MSRIESSHRLEFRHTLNFQVSAFVIVRLVFNTFYRMVYPFLSYFAKGMGVDLRTISYAITVRSLMGLVSPFLASVADSRGRKAGMLLGTILFTAAICLVVIWPTFPAFFISLSLGIIGYLIFVPTLQAYLGDQVPYEKRGRVLGITEFAWSLSAIMGVPLVGLMIARQGWLAPFPLIALLGALAFILLAWMLPKDPIPQAENYGFIRNMAKVFSSPTAIAAIVMAGLYTAANETITLVYGVWVEQSFSLSIVSLGATALAIGISELGGESLVTAFTDKIGKRKALAIGIIGNCLAALSLPLFGRWLAGALIGLFLFYLTFEFTVVSGIPMMTEILPSARATMLAAHMAFIAIGRSLGDLLAPTLFTQTVLPGITANAIAAILFNLLALLALRQVKIPHA
ncbi:MAG TPA: MFS transporter [Anaerolineales bacterium]|nr:MFS transporter [Anaerolineales bacterium]